MEENMKTLMIYLLDDYLNQLAEDLHAMQYALRDFDNLSIEDFQFYTSEYLRLRRLLCERP